MSVQGSFNDVLATCPPISPLLEAAVDVQRRGLKTVVGYTGAEGPIPDVGRGELMPRVLVGQSEIPRRQLRVARDGVLVTKGKESDPTLHAAAHSQTVLTVEVAAMNESYPEMRDELQDEVSNGITCIGIKAGTSVFAMEPSITVAIAEPRQIRADGTNLWTFNYARYDIGRLQPIFFPLSVNESRDYNATILPEDRSQLGVHMTGYNDTWAAPETVLQPVDIIGGHRVCVHRFLTSLLNDFFHRHEQMVPHELMQWAATQRMEVDFEAYCGVEPHRG